MIRTNYARVPESGTIRQNVGHVVQDIVALAELQGELFRSDAREMTEQIARPVAVFTVSALLLSATVPVCLLAIGEGLAAAGVPRAAAYALVATASIVAGAGMATWAWRRFRTIPPAFARSREELAQNIAWIKGTLLAANPEQPESGLRDSFHY